MRAPRDSGPSKPRKRRVRPLVAPPRGDVGTGSGYRRNAPERRPTPRNDVRSDRGYRVIEAPRKTAPSDARSGRGYRRNRPLVQVADPKGVDLPRAKRYQREQRQRQRDYRDTKGAADLGRAKRYESRQFGNPAVDVKDPQTLARFKRAQERGALIDTGAIPALVLKNLTDAIQDTPNIARAAYESPGRVARSTLKSSPGLLASAIAGLVEVPLSVAHGEGGELAKQFREDNRRRYSQTGAEKRARYKREGIAPEVIDLSPAVVGGLGAVGETAGALARAGRLGRAAERVAREPRAKLQRSADNAVEQDLSSNLLKAASQKAVDRGRRKKFENRATKLDLEGKPVPIRGLIPGRGEVVKKRLVLQRRDQRIDTSKATGRGYERQKRLQDREVRAGILKEQRKLKKENHGVAWLALHGLIHFDSPEETKKLLSAYRARIVEHRAADTARAAGEGRGPRTIHHKSDDLALVDETLARLKADPSGVLTPELRDFHAGQVDRYHRLRESDKANASDLTAEVRRLQPLARVLGEDGDVLDRKLEALKSAGKTYKRDKRKAVQEERRAKAAVARAQRMEAREQGRSEVRVGQVDRRLLRSDERYRDAALALSRAQTEFREAKKAHGNAHRNEAPDDKAFGWTHARRREVEARAARAERGLKAARANFKAVEATVRKEKERQVGTRPVGRLRRQEKASAEVAIRQERARQATARREALKRPTQEELAKRAEAEKRAFVERTKTQIAARGLAEPVYVGHRPRSKTEFAPHAAGGAKGIQGVRETHYELFDQGRADKTLGSYSDSIAQSIKRNVNWNTVADTFAKHTPVWGRNLGSREAALKALDDKGLAHGDWVAVDLGVFRRARGSRQADDVGLQGDKSIHSAVKEATVTLDGEEADFARTGRRLSLVPKGVADELEAMSKPSGKLGRTAQKVQGMQSKLILGTNPTFVPVQFAANLPLAALATKGNLVNWLHGQRAWKTLDRETKDWIETQIGVGSASSASSSRPRYGAIQNESSALLHNWRVFADSNVVQGVKNARANPLNWNHRLDDLQNSFFRRQVFKADMGREARKLRGEGMNREKRNSAGPGSSPRHGKVGSEQEFRAVQDVTARVLDTMPANQLSQLQGWSHGVIIGQANKLRDAEGIAESFEPLREHLRKTHGDTVRMFRGLRGEFEDDGRELTSWTLNRKAAEEFAGDGVRHVVERQIPVDDVVAGLVDSKRFPAGENYDEFIVRRPTAETMAKRMDDTREAAKPLIKILEMPDGPAKLAALRKAEPQVDRMADHVNEMLGDYSRFTARERKLARTTLLFYPFLRWALKFTFYTLPVKHPAAAAITAKLGQLHKEEVIQLLGEEIRKAHGGTQAAAEKKVREFAPSWAYGRIYYNKGKLQSIDFSRITPLATQAFDIVPQAGDAGLVHGALKTLLGSFSPLGTSILKASIGRDPVTGQPLQVGGHKTPFGLSPRMTTGREVGVVGRDIVNLNPISRTALRIRDKGKMQGDDLSTITAGLTANDLKKLEERATAQGKTKEAVLDAAIPFRKKGDLLPGTIYRHAVFDALRKIGELKAGMKKGSPMYVALTARESELKRKIGALPPKGGGGHVGSGPLSPAELREMRQAAKPAASGPLTAAEKRELLGSR